MMASNKKPSPTTMTADYWKAEALRQRRESVELKLDIFFETTPADIEIKRAAKAAKEQATANAQKPRPLGINPFTTAIKKAMKNGRRNNQKFLEFMAAWELGHINGLSVKFIEARNEYLVSDDNGELGAETRKLSTLTRMYSSI